MSNTCTKRNDIGKANNTYMSGGSARRWWRRWGSRHTGRRRWTGWTVPVVVYVRSLCPTVRRRRRSALNAQTAVTAADVSDSSLHSQRILKHQHQPYCIISRLARPLHIYVWFRSTSGEMRKWGVRLSRLRLVISTQHLRPRWRRPTQYAALSAIFKTAFISWHLLTLTFHRFTSKLIVVACN